MARHSETLQASLAARLWQRHAELTGTPSPRQRPRRARTGPATLASSLAARLHARHAELMRAREAGS